MSERQKTPQQDHEAFLLNQTKVNSTPQNRGTSEASPHLTSLTRAAVSPFIAQDLSKAASVEVDDMLRFFVAQIVLDKRKPIKDMMPEMKEYLEKIREVVKPIVAAPQSAPPGTMWGSPQYFGAQLKKFLEAKNEADGYKPWINFTNTALRLLKAKQVDGIRERNTEDDIIMQRTDPMLITYTHNGGVASRKPDIAFLKLERAQALHGTREDWDTIAAAHAHTQPSSKAEQSTPEHIDKGPENAGPSSFDWSDVLFFSEHKFKGRSPKPLLSFKDLLVFDKIPKPHKIPKPPPSVPSRSRKRGIEQVSESSSGPGRSKSPKMTADGTASSGSKNSPHTSLSHAIAQDASFVPKTRPIVDHNKQFTVQAGEYGLGRLNSWFGMTHSLGCLVLNSLLYICWFDRQGLIGSSAIDVSKDLEGYLVLLFILQRFKDEEWGRLTVLDDPTIRMMDKVWRLDAKDILHKPWGIVGRNTTVIGCSQQPPIPSQPNASAPIIPASDVSPIEGMPFVDHLPKQGDGTPADDNELPIYDQTLPSSDVVAEDLLPSPSSADKSQTKEQPKKNEEGHAGEAKKNSFVMKFSWVETSWVREHEVYDKIEAIAQMDSDVKGHVPELVAHRVFDSTSTSVIRDALGIPTPGSRLLLAIVFKRLDGTIRDLSGAEYWKVYWDTFLCHYGLWTRGVYHRDISDGNLMYKKDKETGEVIGVLADFDLSSLEGKNSPNTERTGTVPFMALSLLSPDALDGKVEHDYCHEVEAFFWVAVYDTACYDYGLTVDHPVPAQWNSLRANAMREKKRDYLSSLNRHIATPSQKDVWGGLAFLEDPLKDRQIFERPTEPDPNRLSWRQMSGRSLQTFDPSVQEPKAVRDEFLLAKHHAEYLFPSLVNKTSTSS